MSTALCSPRVVKASCNTKLVADQYLCTSRSPISGGMRCSVWSAPAACTNSAKMVRSRQNMHTAQQAVQPRTKMHSEAFRLTNRTVRMCRRPDNTADFYLCNHRGRHEPRIPSRHLQPDSTLGSPSPPHLLVHTTFPGRPAAQVHHCRRPAPTLGRFGGSSERFGCLAGVSAGEQRGYGASVDSCAQAWRAKTRSLRGRTLRFGGATGATRYAW